MGRIKAGVVALALTALVGGTPAVAEITRSTDNSFVSRHEVVVKATPKEVWLALISPAGWWQSAHTWSGDAKNLKLTPQAGGCFCETIPEIDEPTRFTLEGSVEHMRVVQAYPEEALRMVGALGPLQSEPVTGVLTVALTKVDQGTRIVWEYNVGGPMRYEVSVISKSVDGVMEAQLTALAKLLGVVIVPVRQAPASAPVTAPGPAAVRSAAPPSGPALLAPKPLVAPAPGGATSPAQAPVTTTSKSAAAAAPIVTKPAASAAPKAPLPAAAMPTGRPVPKDASVAESFGDLKDKPKP